MDKKNKARLIKIAISLPLFVLSMLTEKFKLPLLLVSYLIIGYSVVERAVRNIFKGQIFDENFLMTIATIGAIIIGDYLEAVAVMVFYQVGELLQGIATNRSRQSIAKLMDIRPEHANLIEDGEIKVVDPLDVKVGQMVLVKVGEKIPFDGVVVSGKSGLNMVALTGESLPRTVEEGDQVISGSINLNQSLTVKVLKCFEDSTLSKILELVENASSRKSKAENFITRFAKVYTPFVFFASIVIAFVPPLFGGDLKEWVYSALSFLVISCPCALVISVPLSFFGGIGGASRKGILIKGGSYLETLSKVDTVVFDKTGTLTAGSFEVLEWEGENVLNLAALAESQSTHPIARSILSAFGEEVELSNVKEIEEISGEGIVADTTLGKIAVGNHRMLERFNQSPKSVTGKIGTIVYVLLNGDFQGYILIGDQIKTDSKLAIESLKSLKIKQTIMLSGDNKQTAEAVGTRLGIDKVYSELLPQDKVSIFESLLNDKNKVAFVGDGINDAPVLSRADIGIAMGGLGSEAAIEASDVVIMTDEPSKIPSAIRIAKYTLKIVKQNITFALLVKAVIMGLSLFHLTSLWAAVFADVGVSFIVILNSLRALFFERTKETKIETLTPIENTNQ